MFENQAPKQNFLTHKIGLMIPKGNSEEGYTWRIDCERRMAIEVFNFFQILSPQYFFVAGLQISPSVILDREMGLDQDNLIVILGQLLMLYFITIENETLMKITS